MIDDVCLRRVRENDITLKRVDLSNHYLNLDDFVALALALQYNSEINQLILRNTYAETQDIIEFFLSCAIA